MPMDTAISVEGVHERWFHIVENHDDMAGFDLIENPDIILRGYQGSPIAARRHGRQRYLMVVYRQRSMEDGFVITAYFTRKIDRGKAIWKKL